MTVGALHPRMLNGCLTAGTCLPPSHPPAPDGGKRYHSVWASLLEAINSTKQWDGLSV